MEQHLDDHREFLNRYYGISRHFYDITRKYFLFGRDTLLRRLAKESFESLVEIGPGTGRNLRRLREARPEVVLGGLEASDEMLAHARRSCPWASFRQGFAERSEVESILGKPPERILYSYCLSMVSEPEEAIRRSVRSLAVGGAVVVVDFSDFDGAPAKVREAFRGFLRKYHVTPIGRRFLEDLSRDSGLRVECEYGPLGYFVLARFERAESPR